MKRTPLKSNFKEPRNNASTTTLLEAHCGYLENQHYYQGAGAVWHCDALLKDNNVINTASTPKYINQRARVSPGCTKNSPMRSDHADRERAKVFLRTF